MSEAQERFNAAWAKWKAAQGYELCLFGMCLYVRYQPGEVKVGAGLLRDD